MSPLYTVVLLVALVTLASGSADMYARRKGDAASHSHIKQVVALAKGAAGGDKQKLVARIMKEIQALKVKTTGTATVNGIKPTTTYDEDLRSVLHNMTAFNCPMTDCVELSSHLDHPVSVNELYTSLWLLRTNLDKIFMNIISGNNLMDALMSMQMNMTHRVHCEYLASRVLVLRMKHYGWAHGSNSGSPGSPGNPGNTVNFGNVTAMNPCADAIMAMDTGMPKVFNGCVSAAVEVTLMFMQYDQTLKMITEELDPYILREYVSAKDICTGVAYIDMEIKCMLDALHYLKDHCQGV